MGPREPRPIGLTPRLSVDQLLWVANTRHGPGGHWFARVVTGGDHDHLADPSDAVDYLERHHVPLPAEPPTRGQLDRLAAMRDMIRGLPDEAGSPWSEPVLAILRSTSFVVDSSGEVRAQGTGWDAFIGDLMLPLIQLVEERYSVRTCGNPHCRLIFQDLSKNQSRRWCDNAGCGNRSRVRRYRNAGAANPNGPAVESGPGR